MHRCLWLERCEGCSCMKWAGIKWPVNTEFPALVVGSVHLWSESIALVKRENQPVICSWVKNQSELSQNPIYYLLHLSPALYLVTSPTILAHIPLSHCSSPQGKLLHHCDCELKNNYCWLCFGFTLYIHHKQNGEIVWAHNGTEVEKNHLSILNIN